MFSFVHYKIYLLQLRLFMHLLYKAWQLFTKDAYSLNSNAERSNNELNCMHHVLHVIPVHVFPISLYIWMLVAKLKGQSSTSWNRCKSKCCQHPIEKCNVRLIVHFNVNFNSSLYLDQFSWDVAQMKNKTYWKS